MKRPRQRAPRDRFSLHDQKHKPMYFADDSADFRLLDDDNDLAVPLDPTQCAYACAWERLGYSAEVCRKFTYVDYGPYIVKYITTALMQRQLTANDQGGRIFPGDYRLGAIPPSARKPRIVGKQPGKGGGNKPTVPVGPDLVRRRAAA